MKNKNFWKSLLDYALIFVGALLQALALRLFLVPANLVTGGVSGIAQVINYHTGWSLGLMIFLGNLPLFVLGWRYLGGLRFALRTVAAVVFASFLTEFLVPYLPVQGLTPDLVLDALFGGLISGVGYGLVYRGRGTSGGSDILARILNHWRGVPITQSYFMVDAVVILAAGLTFRWENALYALVVLYVSGLAAEAVTEGTGLVRTALIVTSKPEEMTRRILDEMERGATLLPARGAYTGAERTLVYVVVSRSEVVILKEIVHQADPQAFMVIGQAHEALGEGFKSMHPG